MENKFFQIAFLTIVVMLTATFIIYTTIKLFEKICWKNIKQEDRKKSAYVICIAGLILTAGVIAGILGKVLLNLNKVVKPDLADFGSLSIFFKYLGLFLFLDILILSLIFLMSYIIVFALARSRRVLTKMIEENNNHYAVCFATISFVLILSIIDNVILLLDYFIPYPTIPAFN